EGEKRSAWKPPSFRRSIGNWLPAGDTGAPFAENRQTSRHGNAACDCAKSLLSGNQPAQNSLHALRSSSAGGYLASRSPAPCNPGAVLISQLATDHMDRANQLQPLSMATTILLKSQAPSGIHAGCPSLRMCLPVLLFCREAIIKISRKIRSNSFISQ